MITLAEFISNLPRNPGLVFGEEITIPGSRTALETSIGQVLSRPIALTDLPSLLDELSTEDPAKHDLVEDCWKDYLRKAHMPLDLPHLAKAGWSTCVSATKDLLFESALTTFLESIPASKTVTLVDSPAIRVPPRSIPIFKLYGNLNATATERKLALSVSELLIRREVWSALLRQLPDQLKAAPLVFVGVPADVARLVLSTLLAQPHPRVSEIYYIAGDSTFSDPTVKRLSASFATRALDTTFRDLCNAVAEFKEVRLSQSTNYDNGSLALRYSSIVSIVPTSNTTLEFEPHRNAIIDALFRPKAVSWEPYQLQLDLKRTIADEITGLIRDTLCNAQQSPKIINIRGEAAIGKTTVAKHVAVQLAKEDVFVAWARTAPYNWRAIYRALLKEIRSRDDIKQAVVFLDDPHSLKIDPYEILSSLDELGIPSVLAIVSRNTDYFSGDSSGISIALSESIEVPVELDENETEALPNFLNNLGIVETQQQGVRLVGSIGTRAASDILCSLWYLVPDTKSQIANSLRDQYMRLGEAETTIQSVAETAASSSDVAKRAYEFVTVTSSLNIGLPLEVLVRALQIDYRDWIDMCVRGRPLWGLLYDEESDDGDTIEYWTRNEVVTQILLDLVNGGVGNAGQVRALGKLIEVCTDESPVYRDFVMAILVGCRRALETTLTYKQGLDLYSLAEKVLGSSDKTLEFHKGIWMQHKGTDLPSAYTQLKRALELPRLPEVGQVAPDEHIHTSMAATALEMIRDGSLDQSKGVEQIRDHIKHATSPTFFNPHSSHVAARMLFDIARSYALTNAEDLRAQCFSEALSEIERALQLIGAAGNARFRDADSIEYLRSLQREILEQMPGEEELRPIAEEMFNRLRSQVGFAALVRRAVAFASERNKGSDYNAAFQLIAGIIQTIRDAEQNVDLSIIAARVDLMVRWRIQRMGGPIDWALLNADLDQLLHDPSYQDSIMVHFLSAVACFHLDNTAGSSAKFSNLRRLALKRHTQRVIRAYYLNDEGQPRRVQFTFVRRSGRLYLESSQLGVDIPISQSPGSLRPGDTTHAYVGFCLLGPTAVFDRPTNSYMLMP